MIFSRVFLYFMSKLLTFKKFMARADGSEASVAKMVLVWLPRFTLIRKCSFSSRGCFFGDFLAEAVGESTWRTSLYKGSM